MEALMSQILRNVVQTKLDPDVLPLDLSWSANKSCDRLVRDEDLRHEEASDLTDSHSSVGSIPSPGTVCSDDSVCVKREPGSFQHVHPFSIEALIGDREVIDQTETPAVITRIHSVQALVKGQIPTDQLYQCPGVVTSRIGNKCVSEPMSIDSGIHSVQDTVVHPIPGVFRSRIGSNCVTEPMNLDRVFWCHVCNCLCKGFKDAETHRYAHSIQGARCNLRKSLFARTNFVSQHVKIDEENTQCGLCEKTVTNCFFTKHQRLHDGHVCNVCDREFSTNCRLKDHMNEHSGVTPFACAQCDRKFAKRSSLKQHQRYHRDNQSFRCSYCTKYFNSKYARAVHERLHTGENPFKCHVPGCTRAFPQKIQLQLHMNSHSY